MGDGGAIRLYDMLGGLFYESSNLPETADLLWEVVRNEHGNCE